MSKKKVTFIALSKIINFYTNQINSIKNSQFLIEFTKMKAMELTV